MKTTTWIVCICLFVELHEKSLNNVLNKKQNEGDESCQKNELTVALAEHLLGRLAPRQSYIIDSRAKRNGRCSYGEKHCQKDPTYGSTGIGIDSDCSIWHGHISMCIGVREASWS